MQWQRLTTTVLLFCTLFNHFSRYTSGLQRGGYEVLVIFWFSGTEADDS
jgi:hypothetical protein